MRYIHRPNRALAVAATAIALTLSSTSMAQSPPRVLGVTEFGSWLARMDAAACNSNLCAPGLGAAVAPFAGGTAHDPRDRHTWISDGVDLMKVDPRNSCSVLCGPFPAPLVVAGREVTGLAVNEETQRLFVSYSDNTIATFSAVGCSLSLLSVCTLSVPPNHIVSGLATDDSTAEIYYATSPWLGSSSVPTGRIFKAPQANPCAPVCWFDPSGCQGTILFEITGLGFDACTREIHVTDGQWIYSYGVSATCGQTFRNCCPPIASLGERLTGLCILPSTEVSVGNPCTGGTAPSCTNLAHTLGGDPTLGNLGFTLDLQGAPFGSLALCFIDVGPCTGGSTYGLLCNLLMPTFFWDAYGLPAGTGCGASGSSAFPIPNVPALCGIVFSSQYVGQVPPGWSGNFVTNCLTWQITAS